MTTGDTGEEVDGAGAWRGGNALSLREATVQEIGKLILGNA